MRLSVVIPTLDEELLVVEAIASVREEADEVLVVDGGSSDRTRTVAAEAGPRVAAELDLAPGVDLLDIGAGRGWPGLYLAIHTGCRTVLTDVPVEGLQGAIGRAEREGVSHRVSAVAASARHLPFPPRTFDAVVHTDVLC